jgi:phospholipid/cholesterol/gamma-HCH transport system substrate-binding protein
MEHSRTLELKVGLAVGVGIFLFLVTMFMLGGESLFRSNYHLKVRFDSVQGLGQGSVVQVLGIPVGNVTSIDVVPGTETNNIAVTLKIARSFQKQITEGSIAGLRTQGALGDKFIYITPGPISGRPLNDGEELQAEASGGFLDTLAQSGDKLEKVFKIIDEIEVLMKNINTGGRSNTLMQNLAGASVNLKSGTGHLANILEKIDNGSGTLGLLINDRSIFDGLKRYVGNPQEKFIKNVIRETIQTEKK